MKKRLFRKLFALTLSLLLVLALAACTPEIHIHTGDGSSETIASDTTVSKEETATKDKETKSEPTTSVATSESQKSDTSKKEETTPSKITSSSPSSNDTSSSTSSKTTSSTSSSSTISKSKAKSIALKDAGLKASQIYDYEIELDRDNGVLHYDVSFEYNGKDYDYEINAKTGKIISVEKPNATSNEVKISKSKVKTIVLNHAGVEAANISHYEVELEKDDGIWKYEISFNVGNIEYEYTVNAESGKIIKSEKDIDD